MKNDVRSNEPAAPSFLRAPLALAPLLGLLLGCGTTQEEPTDAELRMWMMGTAETSDDSTSTGDSWGYDLGGGTSTSTGSYTSTSTGSYTSSSTSTSDTGDTWEPDLGSSTSTSGGGDTWGLGSGTSTSTSTSDGTGDTGEPEEECCLPACSESRPMPGDPTSFNCPVADMPYNCGLSGTDLFDCDDFAYACEMWGRNNGYNICQFYFAFERPNGTSAGHQINIVEFEYATDGMAKYCFIEPQSNTSYGCWIQEDGEPVPPGFATQQVCAAMGGTHCTSTDVQCDGVPNPNAGEVCFNTLPAVCSMFRSRTGLCPQTFEPVHNCSGTRANGNSCHWSCAANESCGACDQCIPAMD